MKFTLKNKVNSLQDCRKSSNTKKRVFLIFKAFMWFCWQTQNYTKTRKIDFDKLYIFLHFSAFFCIFLHSLELFHFLELSIHENEV